MSQCANLAPTVPCPRCQGAGHVDLDPALAATLEALREGTPATSAQIHQRLAARGYRGGSTATMNRLIRLVDLHLAIRRGKDGKHHLYRLPSETQPAR